jgi:hypothetical protein
MQIMKTAIILTAFFLSLTVKLPAVNSLNKDSIAMAKQIKTRDSIIESAKKQVLKLRKDSVLINDSLKKITREKPCLTCETSWGENLLILLPAVLFIFFAFYFLGWLKREKFKLSDALASDTPGKVPTTTQTVKADPANAGQNVSTTTEEPSYPKSASRLIAFLTSISAIVIAISLITYFAYGYITQRGNMTGLDELWKIIAGLGIGVVPYMAKVIKGPPNA